MSGMPDDVESRLAQAWTGELGHVKFLRYLIFTILVLRWVNDSGEWSSGSRPEIKKVTCITRLSIDPTRCE
jgi:hypothetical protein